LPTGGGKSICFQVPALIFPGLTIVLSPLISLMQDQVDHLLAKNIPGTFINSQLDKKEIALRLNKLQAGQYKLLYLAPEKLENKKLIEICQTINVSMLCVDEAHCISIWAHQFRPAYKKIPQFLEKIQKNKEKIVISAFTATATPLVKREIKQFLKLEPCQEFSSSFLRQNLIFHNFICQSEAEKNIYLIKLIKQHRENNGVIYCSTRAACERLAQLLKNIFPGLAIAFYHGGMEKAARAQTQANFLTSQLKIIIATNAFGMGVDKSDVRFVIHYQVSANLENYYQEAGRAGRDGQESYCYLLYSKQDLAIQNSLLNKSYASHPQHPRLKIEQEKLSQIKHYATSKTCLEQIIEQYFSDQSFQPKKSASKNKKCQHCYLCLNRQLYLDEDELNNIIICLKIAQEKTKALQKQYPLFAKKSFLLPTCLHSQTIEALAIAGHRAQIPGRSAIITPYETPTNH